MLLRDEGPPERPAPLRLSSPVLRVGASAVLPHSAHARRVLASCSLHVRMSPDGILGSHGRLRQRVPGAAALGWSLAGRHRGGKDLRVQRALRASISGSLVHLTRVGIWLPGDYVWPRLALRGLRNRSALEDLLSTCQRKGTVEWGQVRQSRGGGDCQQTVEIKCANL